MPALPVVAKYRYIQYTGFNSDELNDEVTMTILSEGNGVLVAEIPSGGSTYTINTNDYVVYYENGIGEIDRDDNEFLRRWRCVALCED
jgi:hypothetical protein